MRIGVPTEIKNNEFRVAITPAGVHSLAAHGHEVFVQKGAGEGSSITDEEFTKAGATILDTAEQVWDDAEMIIKVKEPIASEYGLMREGQLLFTYLHLAADRPLTEELLRRKVTSIAYETVELADGSLPLLAPMSEVAGRLSAQVGAYNLMQPYGGRGVLLGGAIGVKKGRAVVLGGGTAGFCSARVLDGMGADVTIFDVDAARMEYIEDITHGDIHTEYSTPFAVEEACVLADLVVGSVLVPGARTPKLVSHELVTKMKKGSVLVDIAIDQGGCFEDSHPTTHADPTFKVEGSIFYCVANMPGAVPFTSTYALTNATLRYAQLLADKGWEEAIRLRHDLALGLSTYDGQLFTDGVGEALGIDVEPLSTVLG